MYSKPQTGFKKLELNQDEMTTRIVENILKKILYYYKKLIIINIKLQNCPCIHLNKGNRWKFTEGSEYINKCFTEVQLVSSGTSPSYI